MTLNLFLKQIRVHQWVKNLLIFVPAFTAHRYLDPSVIAQSVIAFFSFCFCASAVYVVNDMVDLEADRQHEKKRFRPLASGALSMNFARVLVAALLVASVLLAALISYEYVLVLACYFVMTTAYSFYLKQLVLVDIIVLAILYSVRVIAGGVATGLEVSQWLIGFSLFFFVSLACVKRFSELQGLKRREEGGAAGRGYLVGDLEQISQFGLSAGCVAVLVFALYITSADVARFYASPRVLWMICPLLLYWISRLWLLAHRGEVHEDPIVFALHDRVSYGIGGSALALLILAAQY